MRTRHPWRVAFAVLAVLLLAALLTGAAAVAWIGDWSLSQPIHVVIDGDDTWSFDPSVLGTLHPVAIVAGLLVAFFAVVVVVPLALTIAFVGLAIGLVVGVGVPLLVAVLLAGLLLSPLLLLVWLGAWLVRQATGGKPAAAANIPP
jgi:hypothetical protein